MKQNKTIDITRLFPRTTLPFAHLFLGHTGAHMDPGGVVHTVRSPRARWRSAGGTIRSGLGSASLRRPAGSPVAGWTWILTTAKCNGNVKLDTGDKLLWLCWKNNNRTWLLGPASCSVLVVAPAVKHSRTKSVREREGGILKCNWDTDILCCVPPTSVAGLALLVFGFPHTRSCTARPYFSLTGYNVLSCQWGESHLANELLNCGGSGSVAVGGPAALCLRRPQTDFNSHTINKVHVLVTLAAVVAWKEKQPASI